MTAYNNVCEDAMDEETQPLDADDLMIFADRITCLPPDDAEWVGRLFKECLRARMREAELLERSVEEPAQESGGKELDVQLAQVALDAAEWLKTLWDVGYMGAGSFPSQPRTAFPLIALEDVPKSSLFARIREGKRPLPFPPPTRSGLPWHDLVEGEAESHAVQAEMIDDGNGKAIRAIIEGCAEWQVIEESGNGRDYIVQHRGKGPLYRLSVDPFFSTLQRQAPHWERQIRLQERGGVRSYTLLWPKADGSVQEIPLRAAAWERAESEAAYWIANNNPEMYGQVRFERVQTA
ncbi:MAG: hypothetical protein H6R26_3640 [Proteobacteria bacterium]|nr:hypothetical protein [Pseudomonadota bacterium]